jgi:hypothetical protein
MRHWREAYGSLRGGVGEPWETVMDAWISRHQCVVLWLGDWPGCCEIWGRPRVLTVLTPLCVALVASSSHAPPPLQHQSLRVERDPHYVRLDVIYDRVPHR